jgi:hypothetical protein
MGEPTHGESGVLIPLECQVCQKSFPASISDEIAGKLSAAGITGAEIGEAINRGLLTWSITCPDCQRAQQN